MKIILALIALISAPLASRAAANASDVLAEMNLARTNPAQYAEFVAARMGNYRSSSGQRAVQEAVRFLQKAAPLPPLAFSEGLTNAAMFHVTDQGARGKSGHGNPMSRMSRFGRPGGFAGENIHYGPSDARGIVVALIVDDGVRGRKHRANIFSRSFRVAGVATGAHARYGSMCVMDFSSAFAERGSRLAGL